jgi:hypothetical protein
MLALYCRDAAVIAGVVAMWKPFCAMTRFQPEKVGHLSVLRAPHALPDRWSYAFSPPLLCV